MGMRSQLSQLINSSRVMFSVNRGNHQYVYTELFGADRPFGCIRFMRLGDESSGGKRLT